MVIAVAAGLATAMAKWVLDEDPSPPGNVLLVGDSLFFQSAGELTRLVEADGWSVNVQGGIGAGIQGGGLLPTEWVEHLGPIVEREDPEVVVIELGTNGCGPSCDGIEYEIDGVMETVQGAEVVVWLTVRSGPTPDVMARVNREIQEAEERWENLEVAPMHEWFAGRPDLIKPDGVHLNQAGQRFLAEHVRSVIRSHTDET